MSDLVPIINETMAAVQADIRAVGKDSRAGGDGKWGYNFRGIDAVLQAVKPIFDKHRLTCAPVAVKVLEREGRTTAKGGVSVYTMLRVTHRYTASDGSYRDVVTVGEAQDSGDKSATKAQSVALRICHINTFSIPTGDPELDTEATPSPELVATHRNGEPVGQRGRRKKTLAELAEEIPRCASMMELRLLDADIKALPPWDKEKLEKPYLAKFAEFNDDVPDFDVSGPTECSECKVPIESGTKCEACK